MPRALTFQESQAFDVRMDEAHTLADPAAKSVADTADASRQLREALIPYRGLSTRPPIAVVVRRLVGRSRLVDELSRPVLQQVQRVGFPEQDLRVPLQVRSPRYGVEQLLRDLEGFSAANTAYSQYLREAASTRTAFVPRLPSGPSWTSSKRTRAA